MSNSEYNYKTCRDQMEILRVDLANFLNQFFVMKKDIENLKREVNDINEYVESARGDIDDY